MKKLTIIILLLCLSIYSFSQTNRNSILGSIKVKLNQDYSRDIGSDTLSFIMNHTNYCLYKFQKENMLGISSQLLGGVLIAIANIDALNGMGNALDTYNYEIAAAGTSLERRILAERKYENKINDLNNTIDVLNVGGGILIIGGSILHVFSYRWLKRAYLIPNKNGLTIGLKF
ncbi:hypothetical protein [Sunxiuqinia indica]|uniref:hypothetical protein n=1 Tax=Sunxiuqinia indica TaxID=2692584 RepID=UPI00135C853D|nr:hypothetical protein [Sunxiuqinia indica]